MTARLPWTAAVAAVHGAYGPADLVDVFSIAAHLMLPSYAVGVQRHEGRGYL
ncbi:hypothetical protein J1792_33665 [Streptomyces triculaminicus]|uniref:Uncharacterized protein n=1 Tax=Streptomyces triculaminicus TaxID=2816232 RepID=A0A939FVH8_9ACTN|nr:hypothetical protein [Streptomyces triculaminicus]MBO0657483.1 hypothetical protein [Streptomyces triculaminicus]